MRADARFKHGFRTWIYAFKFTGLWCERLLAQIRAASDHSDCDVERICSSGFLAQLTTQHRLSGGDDPRTNHRHQLIEEGVDLRCKRKLGASKPRSSFVNYMLKQEKQRKDAGKHLPKVQYREWQREQRDAFMALPKERRQVEQSEAKLAHTQKGIDADIDDSARGARRPDSVLRTVLGRSGDKRTAFTPVAFERQIENMVGGGDGCMKRVGFTKYCEKFWELQVSKLFVADKGAQ